MDYHLVKATGWVVFLVAVVFVVASLTQEYEGGETRYLLLNPEDGTITGILDQVENPESMFRQRNKVGFAYKGGEQDEDWNDHGNQR